MQETNIIKSKVFSNFIWRFAERCGAQAVNFIVSVILARLLLPSDYGTIALLSVFITILNVFVDSGFGNALIQKKDADDLDFSSVFYFNMVICLVLYGIVFVCSPMLAGFYKMPELTAVMRVLSLTIVISGLKNVQQAYISRTMQFKRFFYSTLAGTIGAAGLGITMAYCGFGVWALVGQQVFNVFVDTCVLWFTVKWRPKRQFSIGRLKGLFSFGWKLLVSALLDTVYNNLRQLIIGKKYSADDLAYFNQGQKFPNLFVSNINTSIDSVLFPTMSAVQEDRTHVKSMTRKAITISSYIMWPLMVGLVVVADPLIEVVLTEKWLPCVPYLRIFCITYAFWPIHTANLNAIKAMGRSDLFLKLEVIKKIVGMVALLTTMCFGPLVMAYSMLAMNVISQIINSWPNKKLLEYRYMEQLKDIFPSIILSVIMGGIVYSIQFADFGLVLILVLQILTGILVYIGLSWLFKLESFYYAYEIIKGVFNKREEE
ncbi:MAG: lipopolysaccharide biosynthesis protein [Lachnospiraceae bacterium]|nr:lipopolysaccharide biosynthesis protein [Lachnospiraceae bacterium]